MIWILYLVSNDQQNIIRQCFAPKYYLKFKLYEIEYRTFIRHLHIWDEPSPCHLSRSRAREGVSRHRLTTGVAGRSTARGHGACHSQTWEVRSMWTRLRSELSAGTSLLSNCTLNRLESPLVMHRKVIIWASRTLLLGYLAMNASKSNFTVFPSRTVTVLDEMTEYNKIEMLHIIQISHSSQTFSLMTWLEPKTFWVAALWHYCES